MATARAARDHPLAATAILSVLGYALVIGTFLGAIPAGIYPDLSVAAVNRLADAIALVNATATGLLVVGWRAIRRGDIDRHRRAMLGAFLLILVFLVLYLTKVGGGGTKEFVGPQGAYYAYLAMLAIHILLSVLAVPVVLYQVVTGLTRPIHEIPSTRHARVGRIAAGSWIVSLTLGVLTYLLLNHVYAWEFVEGTGLLVLPVG